MHLILSSSSAVVVELPGAEGERKILFLHRFRKQSEANITGEVGDKLGSAVVLAPVPSTSILREVTLSLEISGEEGDVRKKGIIEGLFCFLQKYSNC